jgi:ABC-type multidrug transport system fused ATPase/permease subunit
MKVTNGVINFAKSGGTKKQIILVSMLLFVIKYLVLVIPLIAGLLVNIGTNTIIFNPFALVIGILIYPTTTLIVQ